ncbi:hypothetical protein Q667_03560 [Marinobacter sp. C1S70]|uniref:hypothetical protein n=1 Tax=Marinobacter sp. C1S70 TaxID=1396859 RepID=UPI0003B8CEBD|nr:hypothetical protein [Marinobacter sp. C1S70]ERS83766.1 hypothetical protein Q667_03560 [Marinobacter sp. C1S70]
MGIYEESDSFDGTIVVLHPASAPHVVNSGGVLEFEEDSSIVLPAQKQLKDAVVSALNDFRDLKKLAAIYVEWRLRIEPAHNVEFPATYVVRLVGAGVTTSEVEGFRAAARFVFRDLLPQSLLGEPEDEHLLSTKEKKFLRTLSRGIAAKFANRSIKQGVMVRFGFEDLSGATVQGVMPALTVEQKALGTVRATGRPLGFDEQKSTVTLWVTPSSSDDDTPELEGRTEILCHDLEFLRVFARAYANRSLVKFQAVSQQDARKQKTVLTLLELAAVAVDPAESFNLQLG